MSMYRVSIQALILNEKNQVFLIQEPDSSWDFPGGGLEYGENPIECLKREIKEELGVDSEIISTNPEIVLSNEFKTKSGESMYQLTLFYKAILKGDNFVTNREHIGHSFIDTKDIEGLPINPKRKGVGVKIDLILKNLNY